MKKVYKPIDISRIKTQSIAEQTVGIKSIDFARTYKTGMSFSDFAKSLPHLSKAQELISLAKIFAEAIKTGKTIIIMLGSNMIECGLSPIIIDAIESGMVSCISLTGTGAIHDFEIAYVGHTIADFSDSGIPGNFSISDESGKLLNNALRATQKTSFGAGKALTSFVRNSDYSYKTSSILYACDTYGVPATIHFSIGADAIQQHPLSDGSVLGELSFRDFELFAGIVSNLADGGLVINAGSSVILPEVFLKALTISKNAGKDVSVFNAANFELLQTTRAQNNMLKMSELSGGAAHSFSGHNEIMIPLLFGMVKEYMIEDNA